MSTTIEPEPGFAQIKFDSPTSATSGMYPAMESAVTPPRDAAQNGAEGGTADRTQVYSTKAGGGHGDDDGLDEDDMQHLEDLRRPQFQGVPENCYGAAVFAVMVMRRPEICFYTLLPMSISWLVQMFFVAWLSKSYMENPPTLSTETLDGTHVLPQLIACGYFICNMVSTLEWLWVSAYICLFAKRYQVGEGEASAVFDLETRRRVVGAPGGEKLLETRSSIAPAGAGFMAVRVTAFVLCSLAEMTVWVAILLVGVQYIMWSGTRGGTESARVASVLQATLSFTWILSIDEKVFSQVTPVKFRERMKRVKFQVRSLTLASSGLGAGSGSQPKFVSNAFVFLTPSVLLVGAALAAVFLVRAGAIIDTTMLFEDVSV
mmetsp:Transcript_29381/g.57511  ORF Transcript_29381/g.57511 Transcript_29381/m.57511 type:complete len:375 (+) Transcript_29381:417-1541(+)|eukprot:CAMPEP_0173382782 /NCGR_PEP_ID=MMETSP1356-20130122/5292_1 /TAXON_ID=77927 ORGANISM="Hemiselmis virescens, Strain PCC157" /NCGR_SAMPLE_ID=MMETSP1356 /ASSEMBLY_ACC=CAM_ASM_000847 /LENGTH=374 /DNA_ID=CAMNT_0014337315 /DNA_START=363 /DNA_END=1487 /DNA_ORIENTATION=+